jgi:hypothetical protein
MTDNQLAILLRQYNCRLITELAKLEQQLPDEMVATRKNWMNPDVPLPYYPVLEGLYAMAADFEQSAEQLERLTA